MLLTKVTPDLKKDFPVINMNMFHKPLAATDMRMLNTASFDGHVQTCVP